MSELSLAQLSRKLLRLEHQCDRLTRCARRWRCGATLAFLGAGLLVIGGSNSSNTQKSVEAEQFVVRDKDGRERARMGVTESGDVEWLACDKGGKVRLRMVVLVDGATGFEINDRLEKSRISMSLDPAGKSRLIFRDKEESTRLLIVNDPDGKPGLIFADGAGKPRLGLEVGSDGIPKISLDGSTGPRLSISENKRQLPELLLFDSAGVRSGIGVKEEGTATLFFVGKRDECQIQMALEADGWPSLAMWDKEDKPVFVAPALRPGLQLPERPRIGQREEVERGRTSVVNESAPNGAVSYHEDESRPVAPSQ